MMERRNGAYYRARANNVLFGWVGRKAYSAPASGDPLANAFLHLVSQLGVKPRPLNEARLLHSSDKLDYLARTQNVRVSSAELDEGWYRGDIGPFIAFEVTGGERSPVVVRRSLRGYQLMNPQTGERARVDAKRAARIESEALFLQPSIPEKGASLAGALAKAFWGSRGSRIDLFMFVILTIAAAITSMIVPLGSSYIVGSLIPEAEKQAVLAMGLLMLAGVMSGLCVNIAVNRVRVRLQVRWQSRFFLSLWDRLLNLPSGSVRSQAGRMSGELMTILNALSTVAGAFLTVLVYAAQCLVAAMQMTAFAGPLSRSVYILVWLYLIVSAVLLLKRYNCTKRQRVNGAALTAQRQEMLGGMDTIKNGAAEELFFYRHAVTYDKSLRNSLASKRLAEYAAVAATLLPGVGLLFVYGAVARIGSYDLSQFTAFTSAFTLFSSYLTSLTLSSCTVVENIPYLQQARPILGDAVEQAADMEDAGEITGAIELSHVSFRYAPELPEVIRDLSLTIRAGEYVGIVGASGCGKSTLLRLMLGFERPSAGSVYYDRFDLAACDKRVLRRQFGVVLQDAAISGGSIKTNIGQSHDPDMELVKRAAEQAAILDDIMEMPMKFETVVSNESETLSGGQKQRIIIARALMHKPKVLFLDEATSALDNRAQAHVQKSLDALKATRIVVAHRLSTIVSCDRIIVMDKGVIAEQGTYDELLAKGGLFASYAQRNML